MRRDDMAAFVLYGKRDCVVANAYKLVLAEPRTKFAGVTAPVRKPLGVPVAERCDALWPIER
jgi:hypothetical protein